MKMIIVVAFALVAAALAAPPVIEPVKILENLRVQNSDGNYNYNYKSADGVQREEKGELIQVNNEEGKPQSVVVVRGSYSYTDPEGNTQTITYIANEKGFQPEGPSIPKVQTL